MMFITASTLLLPPLRVLQVSRNTGRKAPIKGSWRGLACCQEPDQPSCFFAIWLRFFIEATSRQCELRRPRIQIVVLYL